LKLQRHQVRVPGGELGRPHLLVGIGRIAVLPDVLDLQRIADRARADLVAEQPLQQIGIHRQRALREDGIPELLKLFENLVVQPGIVVIRPRQDDDADALLALELIEHFARAALEIRFVGQKLTEAGLHRTLILLFREAEEGLPRLEQLFA
jgi:hypothetical protein